MHIIIWMMRVPFQAAIKSFAVSHIPTTRRTLFRCFGPSHQYQNQWQRKQCEAEWQEQSFQTALVLRRLLSVQRVFHNHHQDDPTLSDATLPEVPSKSRAQNVGSLSQDEKWHNQYLELKKFYEEHGHCAVSTLSADKTLARWVAAQRDSFGKGILSEHRVQKLSELDFCFDVQEAAWMEKYKELKAYKALYGDTLVPRPWPSNPSLPFWVDIQRRYYVGRLKGKSRLITEERIALLDAIDFAWYPREARWQMMFEELKEHHRINGPGTYPSKALQNWIRYQKTQYPGYLEGKKVQLTAERLEKLRSLGIEF